MLLRHLIQFFILHNARFFDAIVLLDDRSNDGTADKVLEVVRDHGQASKVEVLAIKNRSPTACGICVPRGLEMV